MGARNGKKWPALDVFAKCLEFLKKVATDAINERHLKSDKDNPGAEVMYKNSQIQWVITIPAIWSVSAKEFMRKAAYKVITIFAQSSNVTHSFVSSEFPTKPFTL